MTSCGDFTDAIQTDGKVEFEQATTETMTKNRDITETRMIQVCSICLSVHVCAVICGNSRFVLP